MAAGAKLLTDAAQLSGNMTYCLGYRLNGSGVVLNSVYKIVHTASCLCLDKFAYVHAARSLAQ